MVKFHLEVCPCEAQEESKMEKEEKSCNKQKKKNHNLQPFFFSINKAVQIFVSCKAPSDPVLLIKTFSLNR
jgi:hypothetical protein